MKAVVYSIPGSGTRFVCKYLTEVLGYEGCPFAQFMDEPPESKSFFQFHVDGRFVSSSHRLGNEVHLKILDVIKEHVAIIPLRSPVATAISRMRDGGGHTVAEMLEMWKALSNKIDDFDHVLLPVEAPWFDHRRLLALVDKKLGTLPDDYYRLEQFVHEWPKVGSSGIRSERAEYDRTGRATLGDHDSSVFDEATAWYIHLLADFASGEYRST